VLIKQDFEVSEPVGKAWAFFQDIRASPPACPARN